MIDNYNEAKTAQKELQQEIDEKCVVTSWLKPIYDELYDRLNQYGAECVKQLRDEGYKVEFVDSSVGGYNYTNAKGEVATKIVNCKVASISHIALSGIYGDSELVNTWKKAITDKDNQILFMYIPIAAGALFDTPAAYMTSFDVVTLD